jgi:hypothetical protein
MFLEAVLGRLEIMGLNDDAAAALLVGALQNV